MSTIKEHLDFLVRNYQTRVQKGPSELTTKVLLHDYSQSKNIQGCGESFRCAFHQVDLCDSLPDACINDVLGQPGTLQRQINDMRGRALLSVAQHYRESAQVYDGRTDLYSREVQSVNQTIDNLLGVYRMFGIDMNAQREQPAATPAAPFRSFGDQLNHDNPPQNDRDFHMGYRR